MLNQNRSDGSTRTLDAAPDMKEYKVLIEEPSDKLLKDSLALGMRH
jgi:hypothetical protein